jgi:hypothetical protein
MLTADRIKNFSETPRSNKKKVLAYGETKAGKTYLGGTFPSPFVIDADHSLVGLPNHDIPVLTLSRADVASKKESPYELVYETIRALRDNVEPFKTSHTGLQTLMIDGVTSLADLFLVEVMLDGRIGKQIRDPIYTKATFDEYGTLVARLETVFTVVDDLDLNIYVTAGLKMDKDEASGMILAMPDVVGSFRQSIGHRFDAVLYLANEKGKHIAYCTPPYPKYPCGIRNWIGPDKIENPTFEKIFNPANFEGGAK